MQRVSVKVLRQILQRLINNIFNQYWQKKVTSTMKGSFLYLFALFGCIYATDKVRYDGYRLYKIFVPNDTGLELLKNMQDGDGYHFWLRPRINEFANVMISPAKLQEFTKFANTSKLDPELMMDDVQKFIDDENPVGNLRGTFDWHGYHRLDVVRN